tara:strand:- start:125 stop:370 length:246 start_codon:yes stop_codon:yes gene_type:complete
MDNNTINTIKGFTFLDALRISGVTNMFGSGIYIKKFFNCSEEEARDLFIRWASAVEKNEWNTEEHNWNHILSKEKNDGTRS